MKLMARVKTWWSELKIQVRILWKKGRAELALYREERYADLETLWVPTKRGWQRGRILRHGQKRLVIKFVDGEGIGTRASLSIRWRDPRALGEDVPTVNPRYSGNRDRRGWSVDNERTIADAYCIPTNGMTNITSIGFIPA
jgi:hypothetical protein